MKKTFIFFLLSLLIISCGQPAKEESVSTFKASGSYSCEAYISESEKMCFDFILHSDTNENLETACTDQAGYQKSVFKYSKCDQMGITSSGYCSTQLESATVNIYFYNIQDAIAQSVCGAPDVGGFWVGSMGGMRANKSLDKNANKKNISIKQFLNAFK